MRSVYIILALVLFSVVGYSQADFYNEHWSQVYRFEIKGLPQSALKVTDEIYARAKREQNIPHFTKALIYQSKFALTQQDAELLIIKKWDTEINEAKAPLRNILESMQATMYWQYFKTNRWKYYNRSRTQEVVNPGDFRTWDAESMYKEISVHFERSLENEAILKATSLSTVEEILTEAENSRLYRPTLYDFIAHQALDFYTSNESYLDRFDKDIDLKNPGYFEHIEQIVLPIGSLSPTARAVQLYKDLLKFHADDTNPSAYINLFIEWINFLAGFEVHDNEKALVQNAFVSLQKRFHHHYAATQVTFELANLLYEEGNLYNQKSNTGVQFKKKDALALCEEAIHAFPDSDGAQKCRVLKAHILGKEITLKTEGFIPAQRHARIYASYRNIDSLTFYLYGTTWEFRELFQNHMSDSIRIAELERLSAIKKWDVLLKSEGDYQHHSTEIIVPPMSAGTYLIVARNTNLPASKSQMFAYSFTQVTDLALLEATLDEGTRLQVVNRNTGRPIAGADVQFKTVPGANTSLIDRYGITDKDGFIEIKKQKNNSPRFNITVWHKQDSARFGEFYVYPDYSTHTVGEKESTEARTFLFTDRSIYRPGQTVYFKGILIKTKAKKSSVVPAQYVTVYMEDVNGEEIGTYRLKTNQYGSFSGEFKLPASGLTGEYIIYAEEDDEADSKFYDELHYFESGRVFISVEEYKRPTFEVNFRPVTGEFKINDSVKITGNAIAFSNAKISNAKVHYSVIRKVHYPYWYYWNNRYTSSKAVEISSGEVITNAEGEFNISFLAMPDKNVSKDGFPIFYYEVNADVTDINGETRGTSTTIKVGYHSLTASIQVPEKINKNTVDNIMSVVVESLNGQPVGASGKLYIYKTKTLPYPARPRPWSAPDLPIIPEEEFNRLFPHDVYGNQEEIGGEYTADSKKAELRFDTRISKEVKWDIDKSWQTGSYIVELKTTDENENEITGRARFVVVDPSSKAVSDNKVFLVELDKNQYAVGEVAKLKIGSASQDMSFTLDIEKQYKNMKTTIEYFKENSKVISIPITADMEGGFVIHVSGVNYNSFFNEVKNVQVYMPRKEIEIETVTFKDKLRPGARETWSFEIKGDNQPQLDAEVLASMYDASLDQFKPHEWSFTPIHSPNYYGYPRISGMKSFGPTNFVIRNNTFSYYAYPRQFYDQLDWFGFTITNNEYIRNQYIQRLYSTGIALGVPSKVTTAINRNLGKGFVFGTIISAEDGSPLPGVNIVVRGTTRGTVTDTQGNYSIEVSKNEELVFSYIGFATTEAKVGNRNIINVSMAMDVTQLSEVVVTALGVAFEKKALSYAVANVMTDSAQSDVIFYAMSGKVAGVQITGVPGGTTAGIMIRGSSGITLNNQPLYVIDGVIVTSSTLDQADIANIQVLKGQAATSLYGAQAANGVIIITTKSGQKKLDEEMAKVNARKDFKETAFFFPHLSTDANGKIRFTFTTPESLTRWKLQLLAHTKDLNSTVKTLQSVTQKELMVTPNAPRFLRIEDEITFSAKISNLTGKGKTGTAALQLTNAVTGENIDALFKNVIRNQPFKLPAQGSTEVSWKLTVPPGVDAVQYKIVAKAGNFSDGEQNALPVLSNRVLVTETMPMYVRGGEAKVFSLEKLKSTSSPSLKHHQLTLEVSSNPAWYALQALPYLMEFPHECSEQLFSRYYANAIASHIINSHPKVKAVFDEWVSSGEALLSNLEKNQELKNIIIQETPWFRDALNETEQKKRIALLFDLNIVDTQLQKTLTKMQELQLPDGGFTWFAGGRYSSRFITQHITSGFGHLKQLNIKLDKSLISGLNKAVAFLDNELVSDFDRLMEQANKIRLDANSSQDGIRLFDEFLNRQQIRNSQIHYLYARSFFPEIAMRKDVQKAVDYYLAQSGKYWQNFNLYTKGMVALVHNRQQNVNLAKQILLSLKENSIQSDELGMYWKENKPGWYWYESPVETQALLIEAFAEIEFSDAQTKKEVLDNLRVWLLKHKQTNQWKTTKATTEAIYGLLMTGTDWLTLDNQLTITVGGKPIEAGNKPEAGTGYSKTSWKGEAVSPAMHEVKLASKNNSIAWAGLYWQYFEDLDKVTSTDTPLKLSKRVFVVNRDDNGEILAEVSPTKPVSIGSLLRIRIELNADRPMEFLHMKDMRASGLEPVDVLSEYKWQEGLWYYQSTKDASTNFFFDSISPGTYVFEYDLRATNKGDFSNGITTIQCMYAPEFSSHSEGIRIRVD